MQLLVFSDTHGHAGKMMDVVDRNAGQTHAVLFLGDGVWDIETVQAKFPKLPVYCVAGNCDFGSFCPETGLAAFGQVLFFYTHGHMFGVKSNLDELARHARARGASVALYGHTHVANYQKRGGIHLFNPGSLSVPRGGASSYGVITIQNQTPRFEIIDYTCS